MTDDGHIPEDDLERYAMGAVKDEAELAPIEKHLLVCGQCAQRAAEAGEYVRIMRTALAQQQRERKAKARKKGA